MFFRGRTKPSPNPRPASLDQQLAEAEKNLSRASADYQPSLLNRAGDLCVQAGDQPRALAYYGRSIDAYLDTGRYRNAAALCRKVLTYAPGAIRARCTLTWIAIGTDDSAAAVAEMRNYVLAAQYADRADLAIAQLRLMASAATTTAIREAVAMHLLDLGRPQDSEEVLAAVHAQRAGVSCPVLTDQADLWQKVLRATSLTPHDLAVTTPGTAFADLLPRPSLPTLAEALLADPTTPAELRQIAETTPPPPPIDRSHLTPLTAAETEELITPGRFESVDLTPTSASAGLTPAVSDDITIEPIAGLTSNTLE